MDEALVETATRLFAELGFDGTSMQLIADAAGTDTATLHARTGDKLQLYLEVMLRAYHAERISLERTLDGLTPTTQGLIDLVDAYIDFNIAHPHIMRLWLHRWMGDAADVSGLEDRYLRPLFQRIIDDVREAVPPDVDFNHFLWTIVWCTYGFLASGTQATTPIRSPNAMADFRTYLHTLIRRMTTRGGSG
jgi:AcrR family transcriptional regulator